MSYETLLKFKEHYEKVGDQKQLAKINRNLEAYDKQRPEMKKAKKSE